MNRLTARFFIVATLLLFALAGCRRDEPQAPSRAPDDPVAAVEAQAQALRDDDMVRWAKLTLPPALYARVEDAWQQRDGAGPVDEEKAREYAETMARLTAPDAEEQLMRELDVKLAEFEAEMSEQWPLMQAAMVMFANAAIEANGDYDAGEKAHARDLVSGFVYWVKPALVADRERARRAIAEVTAAARALDLPTLEQVNALSLEQALEKAGLVFATVKRVAKIYDLDFDAALEQMQVEPVSTDGDRAVVKVTYPLFGRELRFDLPMQRHEGGWYSSNIIRDLEADLSAEGGEDAVAEADDAATLAGEGDVPAIEAEDAP